MARLALDGAPRARLLVGVGAALVPFRGVAGAFFLPAARLLARSSLASRLIALQAGDTTSVERMVRGTGSRIDARGVELYRLLASSSAHVGSVLAMMASWDLGPLFEELPALGARLLLLAGASDRAIPLAQQREVAARVPGSRLVVLPDLGHLLHEEQPQAVARFLLG
jgi:magnesium chelatase accessory protein